MANKRIIQIAARIILEQIQLLFNFFNDPFVQKSINKEIRWTGLFGDADLHHKQIVLSDTSIDLINLSLQIRISCWFSSTFLSLNNKQRVSKVSYSSVGNGYYYIAQFCLMLVERTLPDFCFEIVYKLKVMGMVVLH